jgi:superfamily II DNA or RNA helicase
VDYEPVELTSRVSTDKVAEAKRRLALPFADDDHVDAALATNMISVGLDITRLGLMVVLGQPKASAEYIQATSRVGRDHNKPGLVVTILNVHRSRDRSHYERFAAYHQTFYRSVEATSVTPFSPRALDRGLAGTLVALARQGQAPLTAPKGATEILKERAKLTWVAEALASRAAAAQAETNDAAEAIRQRVLDRAKDLLDEWEKIATEYQGVGTNLQYQPNEGGAARPLLYTFLDPELKKLNARQKKFRANRSMRDVEPSVNLWVRTLDNVEVEDNE